MTQKSKSQLQAEIDEAYSHLGQNVFRGRRLGAWYWRPVTFIKDMIDSMGAGGSGMEIHANEYHDPDMALANHDHSGVYATAGHNHSGVYAESSHDHDGAYAAYGHNHALNNLSEKSYNSLTDKPTIPDELSDLSEDLNHRTVTDVDKQNWNDAASASHVQGTDQGLDTGGANAVTAAQTKTAYNHSQATHAPTDAQKNSDITKAEIEAKLTGEISSHTHAALGTGSSMLTGDVSLANAGTWYDTVSLNLTAGTWLIVATATVGAVATTLTQYCARIAISTTYYASTQASHPSQNPNYVSLSLSALITLTDPATVKLQCTASVNTRVVKAATPNYGSGNNATHIRAIRVA